MMSTHALIEVQDRGVLGELYWHVYMDIMHFPFKAIHLYSTIHFIEKQFTALTAKVTSMTRNVLRTIVGSKRSNNHEE